MAAFLAAAQRSFGVGLDNQFAEGAKSAISIRPLWAQCRRSVAVRLTTASKSRMSENRVTPLKWLKHLRFGNGCLRSVVQARPAAPPQVGSEPFFCN